MPPQALSLKKIIQNVTPLLHIHPEPQLSDIIMSFIKIIFKEIVKIDWIAKIDWQNLNSVSGHHDCK